MTEEVFHTVGTVHIGTESYQLIRLGDEQAWREDVPGESVWEDSVPNMVSEPSSTWHRGGFKSRAGFDGTSAYGESDARYPGRILPPPKTTTITLTGSTGAPIVMMEVLGYLFVMAGLKAFRINPSGDSVAVSKTWTAPTVAITDAVRWEDEIGYVAVEMALGSGYLFGVTTIGSPDTWAEYSGGYPMAGFYSRLLAVGHDRLFKVSGSIIGQGNGGVIRNVVSGQDPLVWENWADEVLCGRTVNHPTGMVAYGRTVFVGKPEGLFGVTEEGRGMSLIKRMSYHDDNCKGMAVVDPHVYVPHSRGLFRYIPGVVESIGLEKELLNETPVEGVFRGFTTDGQWVYALLYDSTLNKTWVLVGRDRRPDEQKFGPVVWDTLFSISGESSTIWVSSLWDPPRVFIGSGNDVIYWKLPALLGPPTDEFALAGTRYTRKYDFGSQDSKDFPKAVVGVRNVDADRYIELYYRVDGGSWSKLDVDGNAMKCDSAGTFTFYLPQAAVGREVEFNFAYTSDVDDEGGEVVYFEPFALIQIKRAEQFIITLHLATGLRSEFGQDNRIGATQFNDLLTLVESPTAVDLKGPWGDCSGWVRKLRLVKTVQEGQAPPELIIEVMLQKRREA